MDMPGGEQTSIPDQVTGISGKPIVSAVLGLSFIVGVHLQPLWKMD
jgi:hypothetical protein